MEKIELIALLCLLCVTWLLVMFVSSSRTLQWVGLYIEMVAFPGPTHCFAEKSHNLLNFGFILTF